MRVSIITPTYNRAGLLPETIDSILGQDYPDIEYLVLDDGSTDNTAEVLARYAGRLRVERHPNMGETRTAAYPDWASIDEHGAVLRRMRLEDYDFSGMLTKLNWGIGPGAFFRRDALASVGPRNPRYTYCGDMEFWLRMAQHGPLAHIPKVLATHRVHGDSVAQLAQPSDRSDSLGRVEVVED